MKKQSKEDKSIPKNFRIRILSTVYKSKYQGTRFVVEQKFFGFWMRVKKPCLDILRDGSQDADYKDGHDRGYQIVYSDGNCRTYDEALDFFHYKPMNLYMLSEDSKKVLELWANNKVACSFVSAGTLHKDCHVSRIGLFVSVSPRETHFVNKDEYWESFYTERYGVHKIAS